VPLFSGEMGSFNSEAKPCVCCVLNSEACVVEEIAC
jgi:hypothetical protein